MTSIKQNRPGSDGALRVTICELPDDLHRLEAALEGLTEHVRTAATELLVLNEVPFDSWFGRTPHFDRHRWDAAVERHRESLESLSVGCTVVGTAPTEHCDRRYNRAFIRTPEGGVRWWRRKSRLPDEAPVYEASWYTEADDPPDVRSIGWADVGILTCTEIWMMDWVAELGRTGADLIATPRATAVESTENWLAAGRVAALTSGAYSVSSNRSGGGFGGCGWIFAPDGKLVATTSAAEPFVTVDLSLDIARAAKQTYPRSAIRRHRGVPEPR